MNETEFFELIKPAITQERANKPYESKINSKDLFFSLFDGIGSNSDYIYFKPEIANNGFVRVDSNAMRDCFNYSNPAKIFRKFSLLEYDKIFEVLESLIESKIWLEENFGWAKFDQFLEFECNDYLDCKFERYITVHDIPHAKFYSFNEAIGKPISEAIWKIKEFQSENLKKLTDEVSFLKRYEEKVLNMHTAKYISSLQKKPKSKQLKSLYLMKDKRASGFYKIGVSQSPKAREKTLQSEKPSIQMVGNWESLGRYERKWHKFFDNQRKRGEWFKLSNSQVRFFCESNSRGSSFLESIL